MSDAPRLSLDHVGLVTPSLEASRGDYETLGFELTPESSHKGVVRPGGPVELWGSGNHCAMFRRGYFEILGITDPSRYHDHFRALLSRFHGVQLIALGCQSAADYYHDYARVVSGLKEPVEIGRDVPFGDGTREGLFRIVHLGDGVFPEAELFVIEHATPDVLWQDELLQQPNGVTGLAEVTVCAVGPKMTAGRFSRVVRREPEYDAGVFRFDLHEGAVCVTSPDIVAERYGGVVLPAVPSVAVVTLTVESLDASRDFFVGRSVTTHECRKGFWVRPERTGGVILEFVEPVFAVATL